jgi:hypothetical protein
VKLSEIVEEIKEAAEHIVSMAAKFGSRYYCKYQQFFCLGSVLTQPHA